MCASKPYAALRLLLLLAAVSVFAACSGAAGGGPLSGYDAFRVTAADGGNRDDARWAAYLEGQLVSRADYTGSPVIGEGGSGCLDVKVHVDGSLASDYKVARSASGLSLTARNGDVMLWLIYQFLSSCAGGRLQVADLQPAYVSMDGAEGTFAFEYRGIYTPSNSDPELMPVSAAHNVDYDWALWGHNLRKLFPDGVPTGAMAEVDGRKTDTQFCFSSSELYAALERYVIDCGGDADPDETARFVVMPADNKTVCLCSRCRKAGNTASSATPAVSLMLRRLAERFPRCTFFTSSYHTTAEPPSRPMPANVGVLVSAISVPMRALLDTRPQAHRFAELVERWRKVVGKVYVWDYMRNYDDYFTPYPCLALVQERLRLYRSLGVSGVFYNGSTPYYASFDDVQTSAIAAMLVNPDIDVAAYADSCFARYYPTSAQVLAPAYRSWESETVKRARQLPFYGGIGGAVKAWLDPDAYASYCDRLDAAAKHAAPEERARLNRLLTATWLTRLELLRYGGRKPGYEAEARRCLDGLKGYEAFTEMSHYREAGGPTDKYIEKWEKEIR